MAYTDSQVAELKAIEGLNYDKAKAFGEKHGISPRSVIAKANALGLAYTAKTGTQKKAAKKENVRRKSDIATAICELMDMNLASLDKMTAEDLKALEGRLGEIVGA